MLSSIFAMLLSYPALALRLSSGSSFPKPLSAREEQHYLELYANGDENARNVLIERNLRLVAHIVKKYYTQTCDQDDLISIGTIGLIKGISSYRPDKGVRLATYASRCIENEVLMYFRSIKKTAGDLSLSDSIDTDKEGNSLSLMDVICVEDDMFENVANSELSKQIKVHLNSLSPKEREIIIMRYGLDGKPPKPQREVAEICGISRSYV
ncbi:MAG: sigma-70 family RNA polymerase sigma factor [Ruminococcaceae bacterium]|nr:sigma-70 family RNA polymerase sigma factor [Oscillospiraceae bacterium]